MRKIVISLLAVFVVAPTSLFVLLATIFSPLSLALRTGRESVDPAVFTAATLITGWFGLRALVRLCSHFFRYDGAPTAPRKAAAGLMCGAVSAVMLMATSRAPFQYPAVLLVAPLLAAGVLGYFLWESWPEPNLSDGGPVWRLFQSHSERLQFVLVGAVVVIGLVVVVLT